MGCGGTEQWRVGELRQCATCRQGAECRRARARTGIQCLGSGGTSSLVSGGEHIGPSQREARGGREIPAVNNPEHVCKV